MTAGQWRAKAARSTTHSIPKPPALVPACRILQCTSYAQVHAGDDRLHLQNPGTICCVSKQLDFHASCSSQVPAFTCRIPGAAKPPRVHCSRPSAVRRVRAESWGARSVSSREEWDRSSACGTEQYERQYSAVQTVQAAVQAVQVHVTGSAAWCSPCRPWQYGSQHTWQSS